MRRQKSEQLDTVLARFMFESGLQSPLNEYRVVQNWPKVAGETARKSTKEVYLKTGILYVRITSATVRSELMMRRRQLVSALNRSVDSQVVTDIHFI